MAAWEFRAQSGQCRGWGCLGVEGEQASGDGGPEQGSQRSRGFLWKWRQSCEVGGVTITVLRRGRLTSSSATLLLGAGLYRDREGTPGDGRDAERTGMRWPYQEGAAV